MIQFQKKPGQRILELGGGESRHPQSDVNVDCRMVPGVDFVASLEDPLPIKDEDFDAIYSRFCYEHANWRKLPALLKETFRVLKPNGQAIIIVPNTEAQMRKILAKPEWDGDESSMLYGDLNYESNGHRSCWSPRTATKWFQEAGFINVQTQPFSLIPDQKPEDMTDMLICASKPAFVPVKEVKAAPESVVFDRKYFDQPYKGLPFYWDHPSNELVARKILARKPSSVYELGCARGYVLKRIEDAGVICKGVDISRHAYLTRATNAVVCEDALNATLWDYDFAFSQDFWQYLPEDAVDRLASEMAQRSRRGLHLITPDHRDLAWWRGKLPSGHEIFATAEFTAGPLPTDYLMGDGLVKINAGCCYTQFHHGWQNVDVLDLAGFAQAFGYKFTRHDLKQGMSQWQTQTVDAIFAMHFLEHLDRASAERFLREARRLLKPDGCMRILVPDAETLCTEYVQDQLGRYDEENSGCAAAPTQSGKLWALLCDGHQTAFDEETLTDMVTAVGFKAKRCQFREAFSDMGKQIVRETNDSHAGLSLILECVPA